MPNVSTIITQSMFGNKDNKNADLVSSDPSSNTRLGALVKSLRCDQLGVSPLKAGDILYSDPKMNAEILNRQFVSAFTAEGNTALPDIGSLPVLLRLLRQFMCHAEVSQNCSGI